MFGKLFDIVSDAVTIVAAPVNIVLNVVAVPVKAVAEVAEDLVKDVRGM